MVGGSVFVDGVAPPRNVRPLGVVWVQQRGKGRCEKLSPGWLKTKNWKIIDSVIVYQYN